MRSNQDAAVLTKLNQFEKSNPRLVSSIDKKYLLDAKQQKQ